MDGGGSQEGDPSPRASYILARGMKHIRRAGLEAVDES